MPHVFLPSGHRARPSPRHPHSDGAGQPLPRVSAPAALIGGALSLGAAGFRISCIPGHGESRLPRSSGSGCCSHHGHQSPPADARGRRKRPAAGHRRPAHGPARHRAADAHRRRARRVPDLDGQRALGALVWILCYGLALAGDGRLRARARSSGWRGRFSSRARS